MVEGMLDNKEGGRGGGREGEREREHSGVAGMTAASWGSRERRRPEHNR